MTLSTDAAVTIASIAAGDNNIGNVDIVTVPADPFGANADAAATAGSAGSIQAKLRLLTSQLDAVKTSVELIDNAVSGSGFAITSIAAGNNNIGDVDVASIAAGDNNIGNVDIVTVPTDPFGANADAASATGSISAKLRAIAATGIPITSIAAGANTIGNVGVVPLTSGGLSISRSLDLDETKLQAKGSAGQLYGCLITNTATTTRWIKVYDALSASVTVGTTPPVMTWGIPGNASDDVGATLFWFNGIAFSTGITFACTTVLADNDATAPSTNDVIINVLYK